MKKSSVILLFAFCIILLFASHSLATPKFDFIGNFSISDNNGDGFAETLVLTSPTILGIPIPGSAYVSLFEPTTDTVFSDSFGEYVAIDPLFLDPNSYAGGGPYSFSPDIYTNGFQVWDDPIGTIINTSDDVLLFQADLSVSSLDIVETTGLINPSFTMNLTKITPGIGYIAGSSEIVDAFLAAQYAGSGGATQITMQFGLPYISNAIELGSGFNGTYSGTAAPVPEPATMILLGTGFIGLAGFGRKRLKKSSTANG